MSQTPVCDALRNLARTCADHIPGMMDKHLYHLMKLQVPQEVFDRLGVELMQTRQWSSTHRDLGPTYSITVGWIEVKPFKQT